MKQFVYIALFASLTEAIKLSDSDSENQTYQGLVQTLGVGEANQAINKTEYNEVNQNKSDTAEIKGLESVVGAEEAAKIEKENKSTQSLAQGVPVGVQPKDLWVNEMGDEDLGFEIKLGVEDLSILKIKNHHNRLNQESSPAKTEIVNGASKSTTKE